MPGAAADQSDRLHTGVGEACVTGELGQTLDGVLKRVQDGQEVLLKQRRCNR